MKLLKALVLLLAALALYMGGLRAGEEYRAYRTLQAQNIAIVQYLAATVGTRTGEDGKPAPVNRADVLAAVADNVVKQAAAAPAPPVK